MARGGPGRGRAIIITSRDAGTFVGVLCYVRMVSGTSQDEHERVARLTKENAVLEDELAKVHADRDPWIPRGMRPIVIVGGAIFFALFTAVIVRCLQ